MWVLLQIGLNFALTSCALWAAITANSKLKELQRTLDARSNRSLQQLDAEVTALSTALSSLSTTTRRLSSRLGMQDVRARRREVSEEEPTNPAEKKAWLRRQLQEGKLRIVRDGGVVRREDDSSNHSTAEGR